MMKEVARKVWAVKSHVELANLPHQLLQLKLQWIMLQIQEPAHLQSPYRCKTQQIMSLIHQILQTKITAKKWFRCNKCSLGSRLSSKISLSSSSWSILRLWRKKLLKWNLKFLKLKTKRISTSLSTKRWKRLWDIWEKRKKKMLFRSARCPNR